MALFEYSALELDEMDDMQQRATGWIQCPGCCRGGGRGAQSPPIELPV